MRIVKILRAGYYAVDLHQRGERQEEQHAAISLEAKVCRPLPSPRKFEDPRGVTHHA